jgi:hypothetical protein
MEFIFTSCLSSPLEHTHSSPTELYKNAEQHEWSVVSSKLATVCPRSPGFSSATTIAVSEWRSAKTRVSTGSSFTSTSCMEFLLQSRPRRPSLVPGLSTPSGHLRSLRGVLPWFMVPKEAQGFYSDTPKAVPGSAIRGFSPHLPRFRQFTSRFERSRGSWEVQHI